MNRIEKNPEICNGKPVDRGTRITVQTALSYISAGDSMDELLRAYLKLTGEGVLACLEDARRVVDFLDNYSATPKSIDRESRHLQTARRRVLENIRVPSAPELRSIVQ